MRRLLADVQAPRLAAVTLALLFASPVAALVAWTGWSGPGGDFDFEFLSGELTAGNSSGATCSRRRGRADAPRVLAFERGGAAGRPRLTGLDRLWLQPVAGGDACCSSGGGGRGGPPRRDGRRPRAGASCSERARRRAPLLVLRRALETLGRVVGARGRRQRLGTWPGAVAMGSWLAPLSCRRSRAAAGPRRLRRAMPCAVAARGAARLPAAVRDLPGSRAAGPHASARHARVPRSRRAHAAGVGGRGAGAADRAGTLYRADQLRGAVQAGRQPFFLRDGEYEALRGSTARWAAPAACSPRSTRACSWPIPSARRGSAPGPGRRTSTPGSGGRAAVLAAHDPRRGGGAGAGQRLLRAVGLPGARRRARIAAASPGRHVDSDVRRLQVGMARAWIDLIPAAPRRRIHGARRHRPRTEGYDPRIRGRCPAWPATPRHPRMIGGSRPRAACALLLPRRCPRSTPAATSPSRG